MNVILTVIDVTGTQNYIFSSNRLRESIGASELVAQATTDWVLDVLRDGGLNENKLNWLTNIIDDYKKPSVFEAIQNKPIETGLDAEVIYVGGGNALILFKAEGEKGKDKAKEFTKRYTKKLLTQAPGLEVVVAHSSSFDVSQKETEMNGKKGLPIQIHLADVVKKIAKKKACRQVSSPLQGLAVSVQCVSTGGVAVINPIGLGKNNKQREVLEEKYRGNYVSSEVAAKLNAAESANKRLKKSLFGKIRENKKVKASLGGKLDDIDWTTLETAPFLLDVPYEFDNLGRTEGEASFIAVVHTDGNRMGERIKEFGKRINNNRQWIDEMRRMSASIEKANLETLQMMTALLLRNLDEDKRKVVSPNGMEINLKERYSFEKDRTVYCLPFRPIIFGGEDVAFICDGRIALALTSYYLEALERTKLADEKPLYGRAGVAIVKSHYPFRRAYDLSEQLAKSAKERIKEIDDGKISEEEKGKVSAIDWHLAFTGLAGDISEIRKREYTAKQGKLNMRPLSINQKDEWRDWKVFVSMLNKFQENWQEKRNKAKKLREALRGGKEKVEEFISLYEQADMPEIRNCTNIEKTGWDREATESDTGQSCPRCGYFDALEMMDLFFPLNETKLPVIEE